MSKLISGKEALIALANGDGVEYTNSTTPSWHDLSKSKISISELMDGRFNDFRLKPRTIKINNIEVPAPFEPKEFEDCYMLTDLYEHGYTMTAWACYKQAPAWRTEEEIKQVVAALRSIFSTQGK